MPRRRQKGPWFWRSMIAAMLVSVFGLFAVAAFSAPPTTLADTNCRSDRRDPAHTIILIDQSDPFSANDIAWLQELVEAESRALPRHGRLTLMTPNAALAHEPRALVSLCSTGSPENANPLFSNPRMVEDTWRADFHTPIVETVNAALTNTVAPASPLGESLFAIADRADFQLRQRGRRLVIVSDLMQHSEDFSFYASGADYGLYSQSPLAEYTPDLSGVDVIARIVPRQAYDLPIGEVKAFWRLYFDAAGADYGTVN